LKGFPDAAPPAYSYLALDVLFHAPAPVGAAALVTSPVGPALHAVWRRPLATLATWPLG
jgi:hypothetical protein